MPPLIERRRWCHYGIGAAYAAAHRRMDIVMATTRALISHETAMVRHISDRSAVMHLDRAIERGATRPPEPTDVHR